MRCRACGRVIDDNSRFCFYCDCDNYPEMNHVKTKGSSSRDFDNMQYSGTQNRNRRTSANKTYLGNSGAQKNNNSKQNANPGCFIALLIIAVIWIVFFATINL